MNWKLAGRIFVFAWFFIGGVCHFLIPEPFVRIVPPYVPYAWAVVYISGAFELLGAFGIMIPRWRSLAGYCLMLLTAVVTLGNVQMYQHPDLFPSIPHWALVLRFPVQVVLILIIWRTTRPDGVKTIFPAKTIET